MNYFQLLLIFYFYFRLEKIEFILPNKKNNGSCVDSITLVRDDVIAFKCALNGSIHVFSLSNTLNHSSYNRWEDFLEFIHVFKHSMKILTENLTYYIHLSLHISSLGHHKVKNYCLYPGMSEHRPSFIWSSAVDLETKKCFFTIRAKLNTWDNVLNIPKIMIWIKFILLP